MIARRVVRLFGLAQEEKLAANDHKGSWRMFSLAHLFTLLRGEVRELEEEVFAAKKDPVKIRREAADVANFAMMIADNAGGLSRSDVGAPLGPEARTRLMMRIGYLMPELDDEGLALLAEYAEQLPRRSLGRTPASDTNEARA